jgi:hypothetical protein
VVLEVLPNPGAPKKAAPYKTIIYFPQVNKNSDLFLLIKNSDKKLKDHAGQQDMTILKIIELSK